MGLRNKNFFSKPFLQKSPPTLLMGTTITKSAEAFLKFLNFLYPTMRLRQQHFGKKFPLYFLGGDGFPEFQRLILKFFSKYPSIFQMETKKVSFSVIF